MSDGRDLSLSDGGDLSHADVSDGGDLSLHQHVVTHGQLVTMSLVPGTDRAVGMQLKHGTVRGAIEKNTCKYVIIHASRSVGMLLKYGTVLGLSLYGYSSMAQCKERYNETYKYVYFHASRSVGMLLKHGTVRGAIK